MTIPTGVATGIGSMPGTDAFEAGRIVFGEVPDFPYLPELPGRGVGADMIGRSAGMLVDMAVEVQPSGWRFTARSGRDQRRARDFLAHDLDALAEIADGYAGPLKLQLCGPWTLAAGIETPRGHRSVSDDGAVRDITQSLTEGIAVHLEAVRRRLPDASCVVQLDEPSLPSVLTGRLSTASRFNALDPVEESTAVQGLRAVIEALDVETIVHCCTAQPPIALAQQAGAHGVAVDFALLDESDDDAIGLAAEAGVRMLLGVVPGTDADLETSSETADHIRDRWRRIGLTDDLLLKSVLATPACGLAGASADYSTRALRHCGEVARRLPE